MLVAVRQLLFPAVESHLHLRKLCKKIEAGADSKKTNNEKSFIANAYSQGQIQVQYMNPKQITAIT